MGRTAAACIGTTRVDASDVLGRYTAGVLLRAAGSVRHGTTPTAAGLGAVAMGGMVVGTDAVVEGRCT